LSLALYRGLLRLPMNVLFGVTSLLIALLAAGMAAQAAGFLVAADMAPSFGAELWDTSDVLSDHSMVGLVLRTLVGYVDRPAGLQVIAWALTLGTIVLLTGANTTKAAGAS
jgi:high-affinity iron transporter